MFCIVKNSNYIKTSKLRTLATSNPYTAILTSLVYYIFQFCFYAYTNIYRDFFFNLENNRLCILYFFSIYFEHLSMSIQILLLGKKKKKLLHIRSTLLERSIKFHNTTILPQFKNFFQLDIHIVSVLCYCKTYILQ